MLYFFLKILFKTALRVFFRRIEVRNQHLIPDNGPLLIASNHPNTFMDPIAIAAVVKQEVFFIAKGTVFNTPLKKWVLQKMNLIPVYRREDGALPAAGNEATFRTCTEFLLKDGTLLIFPEGNSFNERRLRPLKTGTARMALAAERQANWKAGVQILPVGVNYSDPTRFRSDLFINIGEPIKVKAYAEADAQDTFKAAQDLTEELRRRLADLLIITENDADEELLGQIEQVYRTDLMKDLGLTKRQEDIFILSKGIAESIRYFQVHQPARVLALREKIYLYNQNRQKLGFPDKYLAHSQTNPNLWQDTFRTTVFLVLGLPVFLWGLLTNYLPYYIPAKIADALTDEEEFRAPIMMTAGIFSFGLFYGLEIIAAYAFTHSVWWTLLISLSLPVSGFFALRYSYRLRVTQVYLKLFYFIYEKSPVLSNLWQQRDEIINQLEEAKRIYLKHTGLAKDEVPLK